MLRNIFFFSSRTVKYLKMDCNLQIDDSIKYNLLRNKPEEITCI